MMDARHTEPEETPEESIPGVRRVIGIGSCKGGVGKSTVAMNFAVALRMDGYRTGLLDADVYGPSIPMMMGIRRQPETEGGRLIPLEQYGVRLMSLGFLIPSDSSHVIWRGPMVASAVRQMLTESDWGELDYLFVDLPPGTGDAPLTLAQSVRLAGVVVVMTAQELVTSIGGKTVGMFRTLKVPILGIVSNMDGFVCPDCGERTDVFGSYSVESTAQRLELPFLGSVSLDPSIVQHGDAGTPTVIAAPESPQAEAFRLAARSAIAQVAAEEGAPKKDPLAALDRTGTGSRPSVSRFAAARRFS